MDSSGGNEFGGRTALVTGGSRGLGRGICVALARGGAKVAINYAGNAEAAAETKAMVEAEGAEAAVFQADVAEPDQVSRMVGEVESALGPVDLLVTSAGVARMEPAAESTIETWRRLMRVNTDGTFLPVMAVIDGMLAREYGRIVCIASIAALRPRPAMMAYSASKAAVVSFARSCSEGFAPHVRVNCVAPGLIDTDMAASIREPQRSQMIDATPLKRIGEPEDIAELTAFLLSDKASFITGQTIVADGGRVTLP
jgi:3-oxoacyl-[acyl-carrier protein] reductase